MWEYKRTDIKFKMYADLVNILNKEGENGWEVIYYVEERPDKYGNEFIAKILLKKLKEFPACTTQEKQ